MLERWAQFLLGTSQAYVEGIGGKRTRTDVGGLLPATKSQVGFTQVQKTFLLLANTQNVLGATHIRKSPRNAGMKQPQRASQTRALTPISAKAIFESKQVVR